MFHNISNPKWFGNWSRLEDDYLGNGGTDIADNFTFSKREKTGGLFGSIISLATAFPACDPETGHATGAWKVACESIDLDEVPLSDIADMISSFDCETITDFRLFNTEIRLQPPPARLLHRTGKAFSRASCFPGGSRQQPDQGRCSACHPSRDRCLRHPAHRGHQAGRHGKLRGARSGDEYGLERLQQTELHPLLRSVTGYGCLRVRKRQENRSARRPIRASACRKLLRSRY